MAEGKKKKKNTHIYKKKIFKTNKKSTPMLEAHVEDELEDESLADENMSPIERVYGFRENDALINRYFILFLKNKEKGYSTTTTTTKDSY